MDRLAKTYGASKRYIGVPIMVEEVITEDVIKGSMMNRGDVPSIVLKCFPNDSARMMTEIRAYEALMPVQGCAVPWFISVFLVGGYRANFWTLWRLLLPSSRVHLVSTRLGSRNRVSRQTFSWPLSLF
jgi:hypothetical protein